MVRGTMPNPFPAGKVSRLEFAGWMEKVRRTTHTQAAWPELSYAAWKDTYATLRLWTQIVGKVRLAQTPWLNHSWHVVFMFRRAA